MADAEERLHEPGAPLPLAALPALLLHRVRGRALAGRECARLRLPPGYTAFQFCFVLIQSAAFGGVFTGFGIARDFESGFARRLLLAAPNRSGSCSATRSPRSCAGLTATVLTVVALIAGMNVFGGPVDVFGMYALALLINVAGLLWACGVAMRFRTIQAGPVMQMPVFLILFFAPVYVPLALLTGWIEAVATLNPLTYVLEAVRGMLAGDEVYVISAFAIALGSSRSSRLVAARTAQGGGSRLGGRLPSRRACRDQPETRRPPLRTGALPCQAPLAARRGRGARARAGRRRLWAEAACAPATTTASSSTETPGPTRARAGSRRACALPRPRPRALRDRGRAGLALDELVLYELHVGTFSREGRSTA